MRQEQENEDWLKECRQRGPEAGLATAGCYCKARAEEKDMGQQMDQSHAEQKGA